MEPISRNKLRKRELMMPARRKPFLTRLAEKLDINPNREANRDTRHQNRPAHHPPRVPLKATSNDQTATDAQLKPSHNPETVLEVVTNAAPAELEARRAAIVAGRVIESHEYTPEPNHNEAAPNPSSHNPNSYQPIERWNAPRTDGTNDRRRHKASAESIRELRWLIRAKYRLDVYVWSKRGVQKAMRPIILREAKKSDELLLTILAIVKTWSEESFDAEEWRLARKIKDGLIKSEGQYVLWKDSPPWDPKRLETADEMMDDE